MTYAGLKSMIYAGLGPDDPRVKAALSGSRSTTISPPIRAWAPQVSIYYYQIFAKALDADRPTRSSTITA